MLHHFNTTAQAYDACQCSIDENGEILVIDNEPVVGVSSAWPVAVTVHHGALHTLAATADWRTMNLTGIEGAVREARRRGYPVHPMFADVPCCDDVSPSTHDGQLYCMACDTDLGAAR